MIRLPVAVRAAFAAAGLLLGIAGLPGGATADDIERGQALLTRNCADCIDLG